MTVQIDSGDDIVITMEPDLIPERIRLLEEKFDNIAHYQEKNVSMDMAGVTILDSLLLSVLLRFRAKLSISGRKLRLINCNEKIVDSIRYAALEDYFFN